MRLECRGEDHMDSLEDSPLLAAECADSLFQGVVADMGTFNTADEQK